MAIIVSFECAQGWAISYTEIFGTSSKAHVFYGCEGTAWCLNTTSPLERDSESSAGASVQWVDQTNLVVRPGGKAVRNLQPQTPHAVAQHRSRATHAHSARYRNPCGRHVKERTEQRTANPRFPRPRLPPPRPRSVRHHRPRRATIWVLLAESDRSARVHQRATGSGQLLATPHTNSQAKC